MFLHDKLWEQDAEGFRKRIDEFLTISARHRIKPLFVFFDSCWDPNPKLGPQHPPIPGVHNSGWVQSPGSAGLADTANYPKLKVYVQGVIRAFAKDDRASAGISGTSRTTANRASSSARSTALLAAGLRLGARGGPVAAARPRACGTTKTGRRQQLNAVEKVQIDQSDFITFHVYDWPEVFEHRIKQLQPYGRPIVVTEYLARGAGSTFDTSLPIAVKYNVGMINWGFVDGKTQTQFPWDSWQKPYTGNGPAVWHHDVFHADGKPYRQAEIDQLRALTGAAQKSFDKARGRK